MTPYHAKYYALELTKRCPANSIEKLAGTLIDAQVDLNPHQVEAALFAFKSPLSNGAILADEVGLGKTIEAGMILSQHWAERKRRILIIMPASLRKQWNRELAEKFFLPSVILETPNFNKAIRSGTKNPFDNSEEIILCSFQFAARRAEFLMTVPWDLVVIDEAHRLRNVYKPANKTARTLRSALENRRKLLLTATPLQNSLMELFGLVSFIDEYAFGDAKSFRAQYARLNDGSFAELKCRIAPICQRTLRRQVVEYINFTNREAITREFIPSSEEEALYEMVSDYLRRDNLRALPSSQRALMTLVLRKLLASSTFAIAGALDSLVRKLRARLSENAELARVAARDLADDVDYYDYLSDEWKEKELSLERSSDGSSEDDCEFGDLDEEEDNSAEAAAANSAALSVEEKADEDSPELLTDTEIAAIGSEVADLEYFRDLAVSISQNAKGDALIEGLDAGFARMRQLSAAEKAIIFTESRRTQDYLVRRLAETPYGDKIVLFNGSNADPKSREIYAAWKTRHMGTDKVTGSRSADMRSALVDYFRDEARIMIATEAAAEGINLQFCSMVVNYDLPWNPQRIEQRIGRCHRYGQKFDVVVVNFLNRNNAADQRVYELLDEKFQLFSGVFGVSDEILGAIESGVDFENRIIEIYQNCRTTVAIQREFDILRSELETQIEDRMKETRQQLLENFDAEVHDKLRVNLREGTRYLNRYEALLWELTAYILADRVTFFPEEHAFNLRHAPYPDEAGEIPTGRYKMAKEVKDAHRYRLNHPLARRVIEEALSMELPPARLTIDYTGHPQKVGMLEALVGKSGVLSARLISVTAGDTEDHVLFAARTDEGGELDDDQCHRLLQVPRAETAPLTTVPPELDEVLDEQQRSVIAAITGRTGAFFEQEMEKLDHWADDKRRSLKTNLKELDQRIKELKKEARAASALPDKLRIQRKIQKFQSRRDEAWRRYDEDAREIEQRKDELLDDIEARLEQKTEVTPLFTIRWTLI